MEEKILTEKIVVELGLDKVSTITADMLEGYTSIGNYAFNKCHNLTSIEISNSVTSIGVGAFALCRRLTSITIPNSVTSIGSCSFYCCSGLTSVTIPNSVTSIRGWTFAWCISLASVTIPNSVISIGRGAFEGCNFGYKEELDEQGRIIAYKGFNVDMTCRLFQYKEGETYKIKVKPILCKRGFHACLNPLDCFRYYCGQIGKDVVFHEVYLEEASNGKSYDSKVVARKITIGREISLSEMVDIANGRK